MLNKIKENVKQQNTWYYKIIFKTYTAFKHADLPLIYPIPNILKAEREIRHAVWDWVSNYFYSKPIFKVYCKKYGKGMRLYGGIPEILGNLHLFIGDNVVLHGKSTFSAGRIYENPTLVIGDNTYLGYGLDIMLADKVVIGSNVMIANEVRIISYDAHPIDPIKRLRNEEADKTGSAEIIIEDNVWIGMNSIILKGVTIGAGSVVAAGSVVTKNVENNTLVAGNPARVIKRLC